jgi:chaperonin GroES
MKKKLYPMYDYVLIKAKSKDKIGSILVAPNYTERYQEGEVTEVGKGKLMFSGELVPLHVKIGDIVMFDSGGGFKLEADKEVYYVMREQEIIAVVEITEEDPKPEDKKEDAI